jgi:hypothetical protein
MSAYEPPTAVYPIFDSLAFQTANNASLTIAEADQRYLARQNVATSVASITSFTGSIETPLINTASTINFTSTTLDSNIDIGYNNLTNLYPTKNNIAIGNQVMGGVGLLAGAINNTGIGGSVLLGLTSGDRNVGIGHNVAGGVTTGSDNIVLGSSSGTGAIGNGFQNVLIGGTTGNTLAGGSQNILIGNGANVATGLSTTSIAIGAGCIASSSSISLGLTSGSTTQGSSCIAIGNQAGKGIISGQGNNAIAIGNSAGINQQVGGSIILNASGSALDAATNVSTYINPIRQAGGGIGAITNFEPMFYNTSTKELISASLSTSTKTAGTLANTAMTTTTFYNFLTAGLTIPIGTFIVQFSINLTTTAVAGTITTFKAGLSTAVGAFTGGTGGLTMISQYSYPVLAGTLTGNYTLVFQNTVSQVYYLPVQLTFATIVPTTDALNSFITLTRIA